MFFFFCFGCRWLPAAGRCRREHQLHQLERGGLGGDAAETTAQEEAAEKPHVLHAGADRESGKRSSISNSCKNYCSYLIFFFKKKLVASKPN